MKNNSTRACESTGVFSQFVKNSLIILSLGVLAYFLLTEHLAHTMGAVPYLLLLSCPLMHFFMHHGSEKS